MADVRHSNCNGSLSTLCVKDGLKVKETKPTLDDKNQARAAISEPGTGTGWPT